MRGFARRLVVCAAIFLTLANAAQANTYYYFRGGAQAGNQTSTPPASPAPQGTFAILVDGDDFAIRGTAYSATTYAYSNAGPVVFSVQSGALPAGISINATTGTISGTPTANGSYPLVIQGVDTANGAVATSSMTLDIVDALSITGAPASTVLVGASYSADFTLAGGSQPYNFSVGAVPPGLGFTAGANIGTLSGIPSTPGSYPIAVTGSESHGMTVQYPYTLTVVAPLAIAGSPPSTGTVGTAYSGQFAVSGGLAPYTYTLAAGTLPTGITVKSSTGVISGTPTTAGTKSGIKIKVTDSSGQTATSPAFGITVAATGVQTLTISGSPGSTATETSSYTAQFTAGGGTGGYVYSLAAGSLPTGLTLNANSGLISGAPFSGTSGTYANIVVQVADSGGHTAAAPAFTLTVSQPAAPLAISGSPSSSAVTGTQYAAQFSASGGSGTGYSFTSVGSALPPGLTLAASGMLQGTPTTVGTFSGLRIRVTDSAAHTANTTVFSIVVSAPPALSISGNPQTTVTQGNTYSSTWTAFNGSGSGYHFTSVGGSLPPGLSLVDANGAQGILSGTASVAGTFSGIQIQVTDSANNVATTGAFSITVAAPALTIAGSPAAQADVGTPYSAQFNATGGAAPYAFSLTSGSLPGGLTLDSSGLVSGTPNAAGTFSNIIIKVTDQSSATAFSTPFSIDVTDANPLKLAWSPQTTWGVGDQFSATVTATGGTAPLTFSHTGALPTGVTQDPATGSLSGTTSAEGSFGPVTITATDGFRNASSSPQTFTVSYPALLVAGSPPATGTVGSPYSANFAASGGTGKGFVYSMVGALPTGLTLNATSGQITGSPSAPGTYSGLAVKVVDSASHSATSTSFSVTVSAALTIAGTPATTALVGQSYSAAFTASGGTTPYVYSMVGTLPAGLTLNANGQITGAPTAAGTFANLAVKVTDAASRSATSAVFSLAVTTALTVSGTPQTTVVAGEEPYSSTFTASGGTGTGYVWSTVGTLPPGVTMDPSSGVLSATSIATTGTYGGIRAKVTDSGGATGLSAPFTITVTTGFQLIANPQPQVIVGAAYFSNFGMASGKAPYSISASGLPQGLTFSTTSTSGSINGNPTTMGDYTITVTATDALGTAKSYNFTLHVLAPLSVAQIPDVTIVEGDTYSAQISPSGGATPYIYASAGALPAGISFTKASGGYSGSASSGSAGTYANIVATVTDNLGYQVHTQPFTITVLAPFALAGIPPTSVQAGDAYEADFTMSGGSIPYAISATGLPSGLAISNSGSTAAITGATNDVGSYPIVVTATDAGGTSRTISYVLTVTPSPESNPLVLFGNAPATAQIGQPYFAQFSASGGKPGYVYSITGSLPPGLSISPTNGALAGTPTAIGTYPGLQVQVVDANSNTALSQIFSIQVTDVSPLTISWNPNLTYQDGDYMLSPVVVTGGNPANYTFTFSGTLPDGVVQDQLDAGQNAGALEGVMTPVGTYGPITVTVTDGVQTATTTPATFVVNAPVLPAITVAGPYVPGSTDTSTPPNDAVAGATYQAQLTAAGGTGGPYVYTLTLDSAALPSGLSLNPTTGLISGSVNPTEGGSHWPYRVLATDSAGNYGLSQQFGINVQPALSVETTADMAGRENVAFGNFYRALDGTIYYNNPPNWNGGDGNVTYAISGTLPPGLTMDPSDGSLHGTPPFGSAGTYSNLVYTLQDGTGATATSTPFKITIEAAPPVVVSYSSIAASYQVGDSFQTSLSATGGDGGPYTFAIQNTLPNGFNLSGNSLTASVNTGNVGTYSFTATATDGHGNVGSTTFNVVFAYLPITIAGGGTISLNVGDNIQSAAANSNYYTFHAAGGAGGYAFALTSGTLPPGISLAGADSSNIYLTGSIAAGAAGLYSGLVVQVTDSVGNTASTGAFDIFVKTPGPLSIAGNPPTVGIPGNLYQTQFYASGGSGTGYSFSPVNLPSGMNIGSDSGLLQGYLSPGTYPDLQVMVTDSLGTTALSQKWTLVVEPWLLLSVPTPIKGKIGQPLTPVQAVATGGSGSYRFSMPDLFTYNTLPPGITLDPISGVISGTPTEASDYTTYRAQVVDSMGQSAMSNQFEINITAPLALTGVPEPDAYVNADYQATKPKVSGGSNQPWLYTYASVGATIPPGLTLNARSGIIAGAPTVQGVYAGMRIQVTDPSTGETALTQVFTITVHPSPNKQPVTAWFQTSGYTNGAPQTVGRNTPIQTMSAAVNKSITVQAAAAGGTRTNYNWTVTPGFESPNVSVSNTGLVSATFLTQGSYRLSMRATDPVTGIYGDTSPLLVTVSDLAILAGDDVTVFSGQSVNIPVQVQGGTGPYTFTKGGGNLPGGVTINSSTGTIYGAPQGQGGTGGIYMFTVSVTDANGLTADSGVISIGIKQVNACIFVGDGPFGVLGNGIASAGSGIYDENATFLGFPPNFVVRGSDGNYPKEPTGPGVQSYTYYGAYLDFPIDRYNCAQSSAGINFVYPVSLFAPATLTGHVEASFVYGLQANGGKPDSAYWFTAQGLPSGLSIDHRSGVISGVIASTAAGYYQVIVTAMDDFGLTDQKVLQIAVTGK